VKSYRKINESQYENLCGEWQRVIDEEPPGCGVSWLWNTGYKDEAFVAGMLHDFDWAVKWKPRPIVDLEFFLRIQSRLYYKPVWSDELQRLTWAPRSSEEIHEGVRKALLYYEIVCRWRPSFVWKVQTNVANNNTSIT
jgi:hypothetical protein